MLGFRNQGTRVDKWALGGDIRTGCRVCVLCQNVVEGRAQLPWKNPPEDTIIFEEATQIRTAISPHVFYKREKCISVMVQRLAYLAFTEEAGVRLPVTEKFFVYFFFRLHFLSPNRFSMQTLQIRCMSTLRIRARRSHAERTAFDSRNLPSMSR